MSSNTFDPREIIKGPLLTFVSKPGDEKLSAMKRCFHVFILVANGIFVVGDLDSECFENRHWTLFLVLSLVTGSVRGREQAHNPCLLTGGGTDKYSVVAFGRKNRYCPGCGRGWPM